MKISNAKAVFSDVQFWIPVVVLAGGLALLSMLK
ncbi:translocated intimin receptor Tir [Paludisphaera rhizosphaerae]